jgi:ribosomal protein L37AE/L43A
VVDKYKCCECGKIGPVKDPYVRFVFWTCWDCTPENEKQNVYEDTVAQLMVANTISRMKKVK